MLGPAPAHPPSSLGWTLSHGAHHPSQLWEMERQPIPSEQWLPAHIAKPTSLQRCVTTLSPSWRFPLAFCPGTLCGLSLAKECPGPSGYWPGLLWLLGNCSSTGITAQCASSRRNGAFSHSQSSLGHQQLGVITRFQCVQPRQGVVPALLTYGWVVSMPTFHLPPCPTGVQWEAPRVRAAAPAPEYLPQASHPTTP